MKNILCYGDSNTFGVNPNFTGEAESPFRWGREIRWTGRLQMLLGKDYYVIEEGLGGRTTAWDDQTVSGRNGLTSFLPVLQSHEPLDLVIIMLGTNDLKGIYHASVMEIGRGLESLLKICLDPYTYDDRRIPKVLVISPIHLGKNIDQSWLGGVFDETSFRRSQMLSGEYEKIANRYKCAFFNAASVAKPSVIDGVHMEAESHEKLAYAVHDLVKEVLK
jgi:lysophospholipase L1-like esterase